MNHEKTIRRVVLIGMWATSMVVSSGICLAGDPYLLQDVNPGAGGSGPLNLTVFRSGSGAEALFFSADDGTTGRELWLSGWGSSPLEDINPGAGDSNPESLVPMAGSNLEVLFVADDGSHGVELWETVALGVAMVADINPGPNGSFPDSLTLAGGTLFFSADDGTSGRELWDSISGLVRDINPGPNSSFPDSLTELNGTLFFSADDGTSGRELWRIGLHVPVKDINPGPEGSSPETFVEVNGTLFFNADDGANGAELWASDGTAAGTVPVGDINPGVGSSSPELLTVVGGRLFFRADDGTHGVELWTSDGTAAGTLMVEDIRPGVEGSSPDSLKDVGGTLFFSADDGTHGVELWKSDGTAATTGLVEDINLGATGSFPVSLAVDFGTAYFRADDGTHGAEFWMSDGTDEGTSMVADINVGPAASNPSELTKVGVRLVFAADDGEMGEELWAFDLPAADLSIAKDDGLNQVFPGDPVTYTIIASNLSGPDDADDAVVLDEFPDRLSDCSWTCEGSGGGVCTPGPVAGDLEDTVNLPVGSSATYTATCTVEPGPTAQLLNIATVTSIGLNDPDPENNTVWDQNTIVGFDFGDAPDPPYPTLLSSGGPSHVRLGGACLMNCDSEADGRPTPAADGDDSHQTDDEEIPAAGVSLIVGSDAAVPISASGPGLLSVWIDLNVDGDWDDPGEQVVADLLVDQSTPSISFSIPGTASSGISYARLRFSTQAGLGPSGPAPDGEVEDYLVTLQRIADLVIFKDDGHSQVVQGEETTYTITVFNYGPSPVVGAQVVDPFPPELTSCTWTCDSSGGGACSPSGSGDLGDTVNLPDSTAVEYSATCTVAAPAGVIVNTAEVIPPPDTNDPVLSNNSATDTNQILETLLFADGFESGDTLAWSATIP